MGITASVRKTRSGLVCPIVQNFEARIACCRCKLPIQVIEAASSGEKPPIVGSLKDLGLSP
jgi:hypothetical protein